MDVYLRKAAAVFAILTVAGCSTLGSSPGDIADSADPDLATCLGVGKSNLEGLKAEIEKYRDALVAETNKRLDRFLDCYVGPDLKADKETLEAVKLLRGHVITTVTARYAAFNVTGEVGNFWSLDYRTYNGMQRDAGDIVVSLGAAEKGFRSESGLFRDKGLQPSTTTIDFLVRVRNTLHGFARLARVLDVASAVRSAATPTVQRGRPVIANLIGVFTTPTTSNVKSALGDFVTGLEKLTVLKSFGDAYRQDIRDYLTCVQEREDPGSTEPVGEPQTKCAGSMKLDWQQWDAALGEACGRLADRAGIVNVCTPGEYK
jgi:hypothetical protein